MSENENLPSKDEVAEEISLNIMKPVKPALNDEAKQTKQQEIDSLLAALTKAIEDEVSVRSFNFKKYVSNAMTRIRQMLQSLDEPVNTEKPKLVTVDLILILLLVELTHLVQSRFLKRNLFDINSLPILFTYVYRKAYLPIMKERLGKLNEEAIRNYMKESTEAAAAEAKGKDNG